MRFAELPRMSYFLGIHSISDGEASEIRRHAVMAYGEATRQLQAHQSVILRSKHLLHRLSCIGFETQAHPMVHAGALTLVQCVWDTDLLERSGLRTPPQETHWQLR
jgi:hypothetical protein